MLASGLVLIDYRPYTFLHGLHAQRLLGLWALEEAQVLRDMHALPPLAAGLANLERGSSKGGGKESGMQVWGENTA